MRLRDRASGPEIVDFGGSERPPPAAKPIGKGGGLRPPSFPAGFAFGGGRLDLKKCALLPGSVIAGPTVLDVRGRKL